MKWKNARIELGRIKQKKKVKIIFEAIDPNLILEDYKPTCSACTTIDKYEEGKLYVTYTPSRVPKHLIKTKNIKEYYSTKGITVTYEDGSKETLVFKAIVTK